MHYIFTFLNKETAHLCDFTQQIQASPKGRNPPKYG
jgi:hypothetical protein